MWTGADVWTARVRATTRASRTPAHRARVRRAIERLVLRPAVPPSAIVIVRSLRGPLCGPVLQRRFADVTSRAVRPARNSAATSAEAVWFADIAELIACLLNDMLRGRQYTRWWWHGVIRQLPRPVSIEWVLKAHAARAPAILEILGSMSSRDGVVRELSASAAAEVTRSMLVAHGASAIVPRLDDVLMRPADGSHSGDHLWAAAQMDVPAADDLTPPATEPVAIRALVAIATLIRRSPSRLSSGKSVDALMAELERPGLDRRAAGRRQPLSSAGPAAATHYAGGTRDTSRTDTFVTGPAASLPSGLPTPGPSPDGGSPARAEDDAAVAAATPRVTPAEEAWLRASVTTHLRSPDAARTSADTRLATAADSGVETAFGGTLYLINVFEQMTVREPQSLDWSVESSRWRALAAIARDLLTRAALDCRDDLWDVLNALEDAEGSTGIDLDWIDRSGDAVARFACRALSLPDGDLPALGDTLLRVHGRVYVTPLHVDMVAPLDAIRIPVRIAGFDLNPGWLPQWGRVVRFHFGEPSGGSR